VRRTVLRGLLLAGSIAALAGCGSTGSAGGGGSSGGKSSGGGATNVMTAKNGKFPHPIVIGGAIGKTGQQAPFDGPPWNGVQLAIQDINKAGGVDGQPIKAISQDSTSSVPGARTATLGVLGRGAQLTFQTCNYDFGVAGGEAASAAGVIGWSLCAASPKWGVQGIGKTAFTAGVVTYAEGNVDADFGVKHFGKNAYLICDSWIDYTLQTCQGFKDAVKQYGVNVVGDVTVNTTKNTNLSAQMTQLRNTKGVDFIYAPIVAPTGLTILKQIRAAGINLPIISPTANYGRFWAATLPSLSNYYVDGPAQVYGNKPGELSGGDPRPAVNAIVKRYVAIYHKNPDHGNFLEGYASMMILAQAMKATGTTSGTAIASWIDKHGPFNTVLGPKVWTSTLQSDPKREFIFVKYTKSWPSYFATMTPTATVNLHLGG
jgi:branched-chain amino acid transport system substrate-binding protein